MAHFGCDRAQQRLVAGLMAVSLLAGCGGKLNPLKWFGHRDKAVAAVSIAAPNDARPLIATITTARLEKVPGGAVLTATGRGAMAGSWQADLVAGTPKDGVLTLEFRAWPGAVAGGPREVTTGVFLRSKDLAGLRQIIIQGGENTRVVTP